MISREDLKMPTVARGASQKSVAQSSSNSNKSPIFVLGCVRSGTTWLYHMLLSAGNFAVYRAESNVFNVLEPRAGDLSKQGNRRDLLKLWQPTRMFQRSGLDLSAVETRVMEDCQNGGDFLRTYMEMIARQQGVERWADCTPEHILYMERIHKTIPEALIIHVIRDGRDVALSTEKQHWIRPFGWDKTGGLLAAAVFWEWMVSRGRAAGHKLGAAYYEVRYEDLVRKPRETLAQLSEFVGQELNYDQILRAGIGSVSKPNTSFECESNADFSPLERWKSSLAPEVLAQLEEMIGPMLLELGYPLSTEAIRDRDSMTLQLRRNLYRIYFGGKLALKRHSSFSHLLTSRDLSWLE